jgi:D-alanyl-lipoteichoic acid acyltransferase DltB (MBOAT superfamily)
VNFNSPQFWLFFPLVVVSYFAITFKDRKCSNKISQLFLLAVSLFFYACWNPAYLALIILSIIITWLSGIFMENRTQKDKKVILVLSLVSNLTILFFFKYYNFFLDSISKFVPSFTLPNLNVLLPVGISFYTFQALGYSLDVFCGKVKAEKSFVNHALFVTFFPQLVAGPIERTANLLPQFKTNHKFNYALATSGLRLAAWGMFKKIVIADRLAVYVNAVYGNPSNHPATVLALATFFFAFQIYCDFSGYSDIAIGTARVLGFNLTANFKSPYFARSIADFWQRWHISLSTWLKDYVYIPLSGNRKGFWRQNLNIFITFLFSGLWHGAAWHFVFWGFLHGCGQIIERGWSNLFSARGNKFNTIQACLTFVFVCLTWVFFRANSLTDAFLICQKFLTLPQELWLHIQNISQTGLADFVHLALHLGGKPEIPTAAQNFGLTACLFSLALITLLLVNDFVSRTMSSEEIITNLPLLARWAIYYAVVGFIVVSVVGNYQSSSQFIYFTF